VGAETEKGSEAKSDLTNGMTSKALVEDLNVRRCFHGFVNNIVPSKLRPPLFHVC